MSVLYDLAVVASLAAVAAGSVGAVYARKAVHYIAWLVVAALGVASFLALAGYGYIAAFHVVVYVGTSVTLLAIVVMLLGCNVEPRPWRPGRLVLSVFAGAALQAPLLLYALSNPAPLSARGVGLGEAARALLDCWLCTLLMVATIATVLIEAVAIARSDKTAGE
jgi:NADH-quinone oxidoreductase subunit J